MASPCDSGAHLTFSTWDGRVMVVECVFCDHVEQWTDGYVWRQMAFA